MPRPSKLAEAAKKDAILFERVLTRDVAGKGVWVRVLATRDVRLPAPVLLRFENRDGRPVCTAVQLEAEEGLESRDLRAVPLKVLIDRAAETLMVKQSLGAWSVPKLRQPSKQPKGRGPSRDDLERVGAVYRRNLSFHNPAQLTARQEHLTGPTLRRWLALAERQGIETGRKSTTETGGKHGRVR